MISPTKTFKRLGIVGAAAAVGLVPTGVLAGTADASQVSSPALSIAPTTVSSLSTATDSFTATTAIPAGGTIDIVSTDTALSTAPNAAEQLPLASTDYALTVGGAATSFNAGASTFAPTSATLVTSSAIAAGSTVTVTISSVTNATSPSTVYFADSTSTDTTTTNTNTVSIGEAVSSTPTVSGVNPAAYTTVAGEPFTISGSGFTTMTAPASPVVYFVPSGASAPTPAQVAVGGPVANGGTLPNSEQAPVTASSVTEIQGTSPAGLVSGDTYNVVVYNFNQAANSYTTGSAVSANTIVGVQTALNFVPESGVRIADSRVGLGLPKGALTPGQVYAIPASALVNGLTNPTNLPAAGVTSIEVNVTAVAPGAPGNLQVWAGTTPGTTPATSTVNFQPPQDTNNSAAIAYAPGENLYVLDNGASVNSVIDLSGYTTAGFTSPDNRLLDTRPTSHVGNLQGPLNSGQVYTVVTGLAPNMQVALNVTAVDPSSVGNLRVFPAPAAGAPTVPNTAVDTYIPGVDGGALMYTNTGATGNIDIYSDGTATVNVVIDEEGDLTGSSLVTEAQPFRIFDSRPGGIAAGATATVTGSPAGSGTSFVPSGALGVVGNMADINPSSVGNLVVYPAGQTVPGTANIANFPNQTRSTSVVAPLNPSSGQFSIQSNGSMTNATFDVTAYVP